MYASRMAEKRTYKQVDYMRKLISELGRNQAAVCAAYAKAEDDGVVSRKSNDNNMSSLEYAIALWKDGERKGWS